MSAEAIVLVSLIEGRRRGRVPDVVRRLGGRDGGGAVTSCSDGSPFVLTMVCLTTVLLR